jgi:NAD-dependent deacetylase
MTHIIENSDIEKELIEPAELLLKSRKTVAISGAGISVESGIPDFRSPGGLWDKFDPTVYASIETFLHDPEESWKLFREVGRTLIDKRPNRAHFVLAEFEQQGMLHALITQNIDGLHHAAGSRNIIEVHGNHYSLECIDCGNSIPSEDEFYEAEEVPRCVQCGFQLKPSVVLFGEAIRGVREIEEALQTCDLLLSIGTSAQVQPVASLPWLVKSRGGSVIEFDLRETMLTGSCSDYLIRGSTSTTLDRLIDLTTRLSS